MKLYEWGATRFGIVFDALLFAHPIAEGQQDRVRARRFLPQRFEMGRGDWRQNFGVAGLNDKGGVRGHDFRPLATRRRLPSSARREDPTRTTFWFQAERRVSRSTAAFRFYRSRRE